MLKTFDTKDPTLAEQREQRKAEWLAISLLVVLGGGFTAFLWVVMLMMYYPAVVPQQLDLLYKIFGVMLEIFKWLFTIGIPISMALFVVNLVKRAKERKCNAEL